MFDGAVFRSGWFKVRRLVAASANERTNECARALLVVVVLCLLCQSLALHYQFLVDVNAMQWMYFRHGHISHHIALGEQSQRRAWRLDMAQDAECVSRLALSSSVRWLTR